LQEGSQLVASPISSFEITLAYDPAIPCFVELVTQGTLSASTM